MTFLITEAHLIHHPLWPDPQSVTNTETGEHILMEGAAWKGEDTDDEEKLGHYHLSFRKQSIRLTRWITNPLLITF